jgi:hypothetical protein
MTERESLQLKLAETRRSIDMVKPYLGGTTHAEARRAIDRLQWRQTGLMIRLKRELT